MLDADDRKTLALARKAANDPRPTWRSAAWAIIFVIGGVALITIDIVSGVRPGGGGAFMIGCGLVGVVLQIPVGRLVWSCYRVIRHADAKGAFDEASPAADDEA